MDAPSRHSGHTQHGGTSRPSNHPAAPPWGSPAASPLSHPNHVAPSALTSNGLHTSTTTHVHAPLPSPSSGQSSHNCSSSNPYGRGPTSAPATLSQQTGSAPHTHLAASQPYDRRDHDAAHSPATTKALLQDFSLVAEAAKRAQMAVLMRDMESVAL